MEKFDSKQAEETRDEVVDTAAEEPRVLDEICVEELAIDGICGVY